MLIETVSNTKARLWRRIWGTQTVVLEILESREISDEENVCWWISQVILKC